MRRYRFLFSALVIAIGMLVVEPFANLGVAFANGEMMRQATLDLLDSATTDEEAHPRVWAPFVVVGEPGRVH